VPNDSSDWIMRAFSQLKKAKLMSLSFCFYMQNWYRGNPKLTEKQLSEKRLWLKYCDIWIIVKV